MKDGIHKGPGAISREGTTRPVGAMGAGSQAENEDAGAGVSEAGNGTGPVGLVLIGTASGFANSLAVTEKAGTTVAPYDGVVDLLQNGRERLDFRTAHCIP